MKFSIIVPVYNVAPYLRACLDSVLAAARTLEVGSRNEELGMKEGSSAIPHSSFSLRHSVEVICVDDGSTDGSGAILDEWGGELERGVKSWSAVAEATDGEVGVKSWSGRAVAEATDGEVGVKSWSGRAVAEATDSVLRAQQEPNIHSPTPTLNSNSSNIHSPTPTHNFSLSSPNSLKPRVLHQPNAGVSAARNAGKIAA